MIKQEYLDRSMTYGEYLSLLKDLMARNRTTGDNQSEAYLNYARLNLQRMLRLDKTVILTEGLIQALKRVNESYIWLVLTEGWCGDAAQNLPVFARIEQVCPNVTLRLALRDENLDVMDQYLTQGSRSIPKLICAETKDLSEVFNWGPRPSEVQALTMELKKKGTPTDEKALIIQKWYNADKTLSVQCELETLIKEHLK